MEGSCIDCAIEQLTKLSRLPHLTLHMKQQIQTLQLELGFLKMFFCCCSMWKVADNNLDLGSVVNSIEATIGSAGEGLYDAGYFAVIGRDFKFWDLVASNLQEKVDKFKPEIKETCVLLFDFSSHIKSSTTDEILEFIDSILTNLNALVSLRADKIIVLVKQQIKTLQEKLMFSRDLVDFTAKRCSKHDKMEVFFTNIQSWAKGSACLSILYWIRGMDAILPDKLLKIMPCTPEVSEMYLGLMKASTLSSSDTLSVGEIVASFVHFLLGNLAALKDHFEILHEGLIFLITFLMDPPKESARQTGNVSWVKIDTVNSLLESLIYLLCTDQTEDRSSNERNSLLSDLLEKVDKVKAEVKELYLDMSNSWRSNFPKTDGMGFIDSLTGNLNNMMKCEANFIPFSKDKLMIVHEELLCLRSFLQDIMKVQDEPEEVRALSTKIINLAYQSENVINSCSIVDIPIWYKIICFSHILEEIKVVKTELVKMEQKYNIGKQSAEPNSKRIHPSRANTSKTDEFVVGLKDEANAIIDLLRTGSKKLQIVSIVGMPGVGKTVLARKVYDDPSIASHFHKHAWCYVSQVYTSRDILLAILRSVVTGIADAQISKMSDEDLEEKLRQGLMRQKYLIVMDDIWDIEAWNAVKESLPDGEYGSRILFTTQNRNLMDAEPNSKIYPLSPLIEEKPWEFLREMLFHKDDCPPALSEIGKKIVKHCEGLPLAITVIAGLLAKEKENLEWWKQVEESLNSRATNEGYMGTLELSYNHLIESLKPCFLYFGAFQKGEVISAHKLTLLWNAEGFIKRNEMQSFEVVAKEYLSELVDRSLVIVSKRSSTGGVKSCRVHDLLFKFCSEKAKEEKFLHVMERSEDSDSTFILDPYRLCIRTQWETFNSKPTCPHASSRLFFCTNGQYDLYQSHLDYVPSQVFNSFKLVKVLNLERVFLNSPFPEEITSMAHLRYAAIWGSIIKIPASVANLWNLETFIVKGMEFIHLPDTIWKMKSLKHVDISEMAITSLGDYESEESCRLDNIETFSALSLCRGVDAEKVLMRLKRLRKLRCVLLESNKYRRKGSPFPALSSFEDLESLKMSTNGPQAQEQVCFSWMRIQFQAFKFPSNLKKLTLHNFGLPWRAISVIGKLPHLEVLKLRQQAFRGQRWDMEDEQFKSLKVLELADLNIVIWKAPSDPFPCLERLVIGDCYDLEDIPFSFSEIFTLKLIQLQRCSYDLEDSALQILREQRDMANEELEVVILH